MSRYWQVDALVCSEVFAAVASLGYFTSTLLPRCLRDATII